jgi:succinate dehydrogenase / fumarate reductase, cytochrome b subunit
MSEVIKQRPGPMGLADALQYRLPAAGVVSILHRISGGLIFVLLPLVIWMFDTSVTSEPSFERFKGAFNLGLGFVPGWLFKIVVLLLIWAYLAHFIAGLRHIWMDITHAVSLQQGRTSALVTLVLSTLLTIVLGAKLFGLY